MRFLREVCALLFGPLSSRLEVVVPEAHDPEVGPRAGLPCQCTVVHDDDVVLAGGAVELGDGALPEEIGHGRRRLRVHHQRDVPGHHVLGEESPLLEFALWVVQAVQVDAHLGLIRLFAAVRDVEVDGLHVDLVRGGLRALRLPAVLEADMLDDGLQPVRQGCLRQELGQALAGDLQRLDFPVEVDPEGVVLRR